MSNVIVVEIQIADDVPSAIHERLPSDDDISAWLCSAYVVTIESMPQPRNKLNDLTPEISIRIVSNDESQSLNSQYRGKDKPTNVLSFASDLPDFVPSGFMGDLVMCAQVVFDEAAAQHKVDAHHWAHMCIHGMLHLCGFDHTHHDDTTEMEALEIKILAKLGIDDPYQIN
jgi:probable rRNA maturation factor